VDVTSWVVTETVVNVVVVELDVSVDASDEIVGMVVVVVDVDGSVETALDVVWVVVVEAVESVQPVKNAVKMKNHTVMRVR
jgi:hypothetical protein